MEEDEAAVVTGKSMNISDLFDGDFIKLMHKIEKAYRGNEDYSLNPTEAFILDTGVQTLLTMMQQNAAFIQELADNDIITFEDTEVIDG